MEMVSSIFLINVLVAHLKSSFMGRNFRKMQAGGLRSSVLGMTCAAIGSGVLVFPHIAKQIGYVNTTLMLIFGAIGCWWSLYMLI
jgi:amino acid permease